jgi:hypothetical protein
MRGHDGGGISLRISIKETLQAEQGKTKGKRKIKFLRAVMSAGSKQAA